MFSVDLVCLQITGLGEPTDSNNITSFCRGGGGGGGLLYKNDEAARKKT